MERKVKDVAIDLKIPWAFWFLHQLDIEKMHSEVNFQSCESQPRAVVARGHVSSSVPLS
jgi:hypothetical protein